MSYLFNVLSNLKIYLDDVVTPLSSSIEYSLQSTSTGVCITCTFLDSSATGCVAVVHQRISQLNSSGLMNIESSHKLSRSGDTASGCIEGVNMEDYQVGVVVDQFITQIKPQKGIICFHISLLVIPNIYINIYIKAKYVTFFSLVFCKGWFMHLWDNR